MARGYARALKMSLLESPFFVGTACFITGSLLGYWLWRWKDRNVRAALAIKEQSLLQSAQRQAETIAREARVQANEEAIKLRGQMDEAFTERRARIIEAEKRMVERESLINRQLEHLVGEEKTVRSQQQEWQTRFDSLEQQKAQLTQLEQQR